MHSVPETWISLSRWHQRHGNYSLQKLPDSKTGMLKDHSHSHHLASRRTSCRICWRRILTRDPLARTGYLASDHMHRTGGRVVCEESEAGVDGSLVSGTTIGRNTCPDDDDYSCSSLCVSFVEYTAPSTEPVRSFRMLRVLDGNFSKRFDQINRPTRRRRYRLLYTRWQQ